MASAPISFAIAVVVAAAVIWLAIGRSYRGALAKNAQIEPNGPTQDVAQAQTDVLAQMVASTLGSRWEPLNEAQIAALSAKLTDIPKIRVQIMYDNALGKELAQSLYDAFHQAEWRGTTLGIGSGLGPGVTIGQGAGTATFALKSAIETASKVKVEILRPDQPQWPGVVFLAVGINST
jgi:hypothetical protein